VQRNKDVQPEPAELAQPTGGWRDRLGRANRPFVLLLVLLLALGIVFFYYTTTTPQFEDSIGYIHAGERLAEGQGPTYEDPNNEFAGPYFAMYAFQIRRDGDSRMFLGYPPGYPLLIALGIIATGTEEAAHYVVPLLALIGVAATFYLGRLLSGSDWIGLWSAVLIGLSPAYWQFSTAAWSEIPSTTIMISGLCLYLLSLQANRTRRQVILLSVLGGLLIGYSFYIRYSNVVILPAIAAFELVSKKLSIKNERERWSFYAILGVSVVGILLFNNFYYGGPFLTSYSPEHGWYPNAPFSLSYMFGSSFVGGRSMIEAAKTLWANFPIGLLLVPAGWYFLPRSSRVLTAGAILGFVLLYALYAFAPTGINSRFLIPAFPFIAVSIAQTIGTIGQQFQSKKVSRFAGIALFLLLFLPVPKQVRDLEAAEKNSQTSIKYAQSLAGRTESEAVLLSYVQNDRLAYYGARSVLNYRRIPVSDPEEGRYRLEMLEPCLVESVDRLLLNEIPVYYIEDSSPPFWNSLAILNDNYDLELVGESPATYMISNSDARSNQADDSIPFSCEVLP